tara:strand:+ start:7831 stop:9039 length:1209 start_codon:yes stop_codon:yes gene_type:complete
MHSFQVIMDRNTAQRMGDKVLKDQADYLITAAKRGRGKKNWSCKDTYSQGTSSLGYRFSVKLTFDKVGGRKDPEIAYKDKDDILTRLIKAGQNAKFNKYPWKMRGNEETPEPSGGGPVVVTEDTEGTQTIGQYEEVTAASDIVIPEILLSGSDEAVENHEVFKGIYGRSPHIRTAMAVLHAAFTTQMQRRHNILFWGYPGCAKSHIVNGIKAFLGPNAVLELDSTSTTKPGIEKIFLSGLQTGVPPVVIMEEIEKTDENALRVWLSALDERREIRKLNFNVAKVRKIDILCIATANDKVAFDKLFRASNQGGRGALSSRFTKQVYIPRPDRAIMARILARDIKEFGGKEEWIEPCLDLADELKTNDPREVLGMLVGEDRLLDKSYQADILSIHAQETADYKE